MAPLLPNVVSLMIPMSKSTSFPAANTFLGMVLRVTLMALVGMVLGALFGWGAGSLAPTFFAQMQPWTSVEPIGMAIVLGAFGGVLCGGALGTFALGLQLLLTWRTGPVERSE